MSYLVFHLEKYKNGNVAGLQRHNQRENKSYSNNDIDINKSSFNYDLVNEQPISFNKKIKNIIDTKRKSDRALRKDAVVYCECIISSDNDFFKNLELEEQKRFFDVSLKFLENRIGKDNLVSATVHLDETTPHMHFGFVPMNTDGSLSAKKMVNRSFLREIQENLPYTLKKHGFDIDRGEKDSKVKHLDQKVYKSNLNKEIKRLEYLNFEIDKINLEKKEALLGGVRLTHEEFNNLKDLAKSFILNKNRLEKLDYLENNLKDQEKILFLKHKNLERLESKFNNLYKKQLNINRDFENLEKENSILSYKVRKFEDLEKENLRLKLENENLKKDFKIKKESLDFLQERFDEIDSIIASSKELTDLFYNTQDLFLEKQKQKNKSKSYQHDM
ncbi:MobV family relaxase [Clostridium perfringens]|nr:MobV family relaxase [Clostridium perfringens]